MMFDISTHDILFPCFSQISTVAPSNDNRSKWDLKQPPVLEKTRNADRHHLDVSMSHCAAGHCSSGRRFKVMPEVHSWSNFVLLTFDTGEGSAKVVKSSL